MGNQWYQKVKRKHVAIAIAVTFFICLFYNLLPLIKRDYPREQLLIENLDRFEFETEAGNNAIFENTFLFDLVDNLDKNSIRIKHNDDLIKPDSLDIFAGRIRMFHMGLNGAYSGVAAVIKYPIRQEVKGIKHRETLTLSDLVFVKSFKFTVEYKFGDTIEFNYRLVQTSVTNGETILPEVYDNGSKFPIDYWQSSVSETSLNWTNLALYLLGFITVEGFILVLPRIGFNTEESKTSESGLSTVSDYFKYDLENSEKRASEVYNRSTLMLVSGVLVALLGVVVFTIYMEEPRDYIDNGQFRWEEYLAYSVRPTSMLIFIEFIAMFLLRQYRALINDYKFFYKIFLTRLDSTLSYKVVESSNLKKDLKKSLLGILSDRSQKLDWVSINDQLDSQSDIKAMRANVSDIKEIVKLVKG